MSGSLYKEWDRSWPALNKSWQWLVENKLMDREIDQELISTLDDCGVTLHQRYQSADLLAWSTTVIEVCRKRGDSPAELRAMVMQGGALLQQDHVAEAIEVIDEVLARTKADRTTTGPELVGMIVSLAAMIGGQHLVSGQAPRYREAEALLDRAASIPPPDHPDQVSILLTRASLRLDQGALDDVQNLVHHALAIAKEHNAPPPSLITSFYLLAAVASGRGDYQLSADYARQAAQIESIPIDEAAALHQGAIVHDLGGDYELAEESFLRALQIREQTLGDGHLATAETVAALAGVYQQTGRTAEAATLYERAYDVYCKTLGSDHLKTAEILKGIGEFHDEQGRYESAFESLTSVLNVRERFLGRDHEEVSSVLLSLGLVLIHQGQYEKAEPFYRRALAIRLAVFGPQDIRTATVQGRLATLCRNLKRYPEAEALYRQALVTGENTPGHGREFTAVVLHNMGVLFEEQSRQEEAKAYFQREIAIRENGSG